MTMKRTTLLAILIGFTAVQAFAAEPGFYVGASGGVTTAKLDQDFVVGGVRSSIDLDEDETGYKGFVGFQFTPWLGIEGGYGVLGEPSADNSFGGNEAELEIEINSLQGFLVGTIPLGALDIFGKIGGASLSTDSDLHFRGPLVPGGSQSRSNGNDDAVMAYGAGVALNFGDGHWSVRAEYEGYDTDNLDDLYFISAGLVYRFFSKPEPVAAPAPAPAPRPAAVAPATSARDSDRDGVPDATDQCPNTPAGARVGPGGCDCDYTLHLEFAFDSAELSAADKTKIDAIIPVLKNPKVAFIAGEVDGYTDSTGEEAYNLDLSKRRAEAVANYAKSQGVTLGDRFVTHGYGEANPVASNDTAEGRAQNRRVVLRRTDCGPAH
jgi:outer membrane protein OmpA-like peptidoglycan-associated protein